MEEKLQNEKCELETGSSYTRDILCGKRLLSSHHHIPVSCLCDVITLLRNDKMVGGVYRESRGYRSCCHVAPAINERGGGGEKWAHDDSSALFSISVGLYIHTHNKYMYVVQKIRHIPQT